MLVPSTDSKIVRWLSMIEFMSTVERCIRNRLHCIQLIEERTEIQNTAEQRAKDLRSECGSRWQFHI